MFLLKKLKKLLMTRGTYGFTLDFKFPSAFSVDSSLLDVISGVSEVSGPSESIELRFSSL